MRFSNEIPSSVTYTTYEETWRKLRSLSSVLACIANVHDRVGIFGPTCEEWILSDISAVLCGVVSIPVQVTYPENILIHILRETESSVILFCGDKSHFDTLQHILQTTNVKHIIMCTLSPDIITNTLPNINLIWWDAEMIPESEITLPLIKTDDVITILYTSGTSGTPKGVMQTDGWWNHFIRNPWSYDPLVGLSFMPLTHATGRMFIYTLIFNGGCAALHTQPDLALLFEEFLLVNPTIVVSAPRLYNMIYCEYEQAIRGKTNQEINVIEEKYKKIFGSRVQAICFGGAATSEKVFGFFSKIFDCIVADGYGASEVGGIAINNQIIPGVEVKLIDVPELEYYVNDVPFPRGEICVKTPTMFNGYLHSTEKSPFDDDGFYHTGDIGQLEGKSSLRLIDRRKNVFKLSQGEFVAAQRIESIYSSIPMINQICVYGNTFMDSILAIVVINEIELNTWCKETGNNDSLVSVLASKELERYVISLIDDTAKKEQLEPFNVPLGVILTTDAFTEENDFLTASMKLKRNSIIAHYQQQLDTLYSIISSPVAMQSVPSLCDKEAIQKDIKSIFISIIKQNEVFPDAMPLKLIGGDSLCVVSFSRMISTRYNVSLSPVLIIQQEMNINDVAQFIVDPSTMKQKVNIDISEEIETLKIQEMKKWVDMSPVRCSRPEDWQSVLVTGATGFLGSFLVIYLLKNTSYTVVCLVRGTNQQAARERLEKILKRISTDVPFSRLKVVLGDVTTKELGVSNLETIDCIIHSAANTNSFDTYSQLYGVNVQGTLHVLDLLRTLPENKRNLLYVSTAGFLMHGQGGTEEVAVDSESISSLSGYCQTKFVSESIIRHFINLEWIKGVVVRPTMIGGCSDSGICSSTDWVSRLIRGSLSMGKFPRLNKTEYCLDWVPVNFCCEIITQLVANSKNWEQAQKWEILHIHNNSGKTDFGVLGEMLATLGHVELVDYAVWREEMKLNDILSVISPMFFSSGFPLNKSTVGSKYLTPFSPDISSSVISRYVIHLQNQK